MTLPGIQGFCQEHQRDWLYLMRGRNNQEFHQILYEQLHFCSLLPRATNFGEVASAVRRNANRPSSFNLERFFLFLFLQKVQDAEYNQWLQDHPTGPPILYCILLHWSMITTSIGLLCITLQDPPKQLIHVDPFGKDFTRSPSGKWRHEIILGLCWSWPVVACVGFLMNPQLAPSFVGVC